MHDLRMHLRDIRWADASEECKKKNFRAEVMCNRMFVFMESYFGRMQNAVTCGMWYIVVVVSCVKFGNLFLASMMLFTLSRLWRN